MKTKQLIIYSFFMALVISLSFAIIGLVNYVENKNKLTSSDITASANYQIKSLQEELAELYVTKSDFEVEKSDITPRLTELENTQTQTNTEIETLENRLATLENDADTNAEEIATIKARLIELESAKTTTANDIANLQTRLSTVETKISTLENKIATIETQITLLQNLVNDLKNTGTMVPNNQKSMTNLTSSNFAIGNVLCTMTKNGYAILQISSNDKLFLNLAVYDSTSTFIYNQSLETLAGSTSQTNTLVFPLKKGWSLKVENASSFTLNWSTLTLVETA